ncbi:MAG: DUF192 domain-containing protein [Alphaproteobacteria bacterium]|nr:DUF192 domain-containing protein [Alphaproteobacteria bacterium]
MIRFAVLLFLVAGCYPAKDSLEILKANGEKVKFNIELAETPQEKRTGLMFRTEMAENAGMLFDFGKTAPVSMWMKNTFISLDMIFISKDGKILGIAERTTPKSEKNIFSQVPVRAVLEINGGTADKLGIKTGNTVIHSLFK